MPEHAVALPEHVSLRACEHLLRPDRQEDLCFALYRTSTGSHRRTALVYDLVLPETGDREVHGNAAFDSRFIRRALRRAEAENAGLAFMHSHPLGRGWQDMSTDDTAAELGHAAVVHSVSGLPFLGLTVASEGRWSARLWMRSENGQYERADCSRVRVVGEALVTTYHPSIPVGPTRAQIRTVNFWGEDKHREFTGLRVGIVGLGSVGSIVAQSLARIGVVQLTLIDHDIVKLHNLDRTLGATEADATANRPKVLVAARESARGATSVTFKAEKVIASVVEETGFRAALDCDVLFSCVDRPWARHVLNAIAYSHLIPVIDGGILVRFHERTGAFLGADWAVRTAGPGRRCLLCSGAYDLANVSLEQTGLLEDSSYIAGLPESSPLKRRENILPLSLGVASFEVLQLVAMVSGLMGLRDLHEQRYSYYPGVVRVEERENCEERCPFVDLVSAGDAAPKVTGLDRSVDASKRRSKRTRATNVEP